MAFAVVLFTGDNSVETIPDEWLTPKRKNCVWPEDMPYSKLKRCLRGEFNLEIGGWKKLPVRVLAQSDDYGKAKKKEMAAQFSSNCDSDENARGKGKRKKKTAPIQSDSDTTDVDEIPLAKIGEFPPKRTCTIRETLEFDTQSCLELIQNKDVPAGSPFESLISPSAVKVTEKTNGPEQPGPCPPNASFEEIVLQRLVSIEYEIKLLKQNSSELTSRIINLTPVSANQSKVLDLPIPIANSEELAIVEKFCDSKENMAAMVSFLSKLGGKTPKDVTYNTMRRVMSVELSRSYSLCGRKGKAAFEQLNLYKAVLHAIQSVTQITETDARNFMGVFLAGAKDRLGGRKERAMNKEINNNNVEQ